MSTQPGIYDSPLPDGFVLCQYTLDIALAAGDSPDDDDKLPERRRPTKATLAITPKSNGFTDSTTFYGPTSWTETAVSGHFDFWAINPAASTITPNDWSYSCVLTVDQLRWSTFDLPAGSTDGPTDLRVAAQLGVSTATTGDVSLAEALRRQYEGMVLGYKAATISGAKTIGSDTGAWALDLAADTVLTIEGSNGASVALDVVTNGHTLTVTDGPTVTADSFVALGRSRGLWKGGAAAASTGGTDTGTGGSTGGGGSTTPSTEIGHMDLTGVADGTDFTAVGLTSGQKFSLVGGSSGLTVQGGKLAATPGTNTEAKCYIRTANQVITYTYSMVASDGSSHQNLRLGIYTDNGNCALNISNDGTCSSLGDPGFGYSWTQSATPYVPTSGTVKVTFDSTDSTTKFELNGKLVGTFSNSNNPKKAQGPYFYASNGSGTAANSLTINSIVVEVPN